MSQEEPGARNGRDGRARVWRWAPWGLALAFLGLGLTLWEPLPPGIWHDDGVYVLLGRSLAEGEGLRYVGVPGAPLAPKFPPLFPLLLSIVWLILPGFPGNVPALGVLNLLATALAAGVFSQYLMRVLKLPPPAALSLTALIWLSAHLWRVAVIPLSEPLFLLGLLLALWAGGRMEERVGRTPLLLFLLAGGCTLYARTLGVAVLVAGVIALLLRGRKRAALWTALASFALLLPWIYWTGEAAETVSPALLDTLGPYGGWLRSQALARPLDFALFVLGNAVHLLTRTLALLLPGLTEPVLYLGLLLVPFLLLGLWELFQRSPILPLALLLSLGVILLWPYQEIRLVVPFQPLLMLCVLMGYWRVLQTGGLPAGLRISGAMTALTWIVFYLSVNLFRLGSGWLDEPYRIRSSALLDAVRAVEEKTPQNAVIGAPELWAGLHLYTGRTVVPSARFHPLAGSAPVGGTPKEQYEIWIESGVTHILVEHGGRVHGAALDRIDALCPPGTVVLLDSQPGQFLVGLRWDRACQERVLGGGS